MRRRVSTAEVFVFNALAALGLVVLCARWPAHTSLSRLPQCFSNVKQLATATHCYAADHDDRWPPSVSSEPQLGQCPTVRDALRAYVRSEAVWRHSKWDPENHRRLVSYHPNGNLFTRRGLDGQTITRPEATIAFREAYNRRAYATAVCRPYQQDDRPGPANDDFCPDGFGCDHYGGYFAYADGHAKAHPPEWYQAANVDGLELRLVP